MVEPDAVIFSLSDLLLQLVQMHQHFVGLSDETVFDLLHSIEQAMMLIELGGYGLQLVLIVGSAIENNK